MTTRIYGPEQGSYLLIYVDLTATGNTVTVRASDGLLAGTAEVDRAEFLAAVARELDVIVIPRTDLPAVEAAEHGDGSLYYVGGQLADTFSQTPEKLRHTGRRFLALAEHLDQNPPVKVTTAEIDSLLAQVQTDRERSNYWKTRRPDLDAVEAYLGSLRDHLTTQDGAR